MPYIPSKDRRDLDPHIDELVDAIKKEAQEHDGDFEGLLNYVLTRIVLRIIPERRYKFIARVTGVLENVKQEFYRRFAVPYEEEKKEETGDVY